jgi:MoxR-like ATPase
MKASQAYAMLKGRDFVTPDDIQYLAPFVFSHRMILRSEARYDGITPEEIVERILAKTNVPIKRLVKQ